MIRFLRSGGNDVSELDSQYGKIDRVSLVEAGKRIVDSIMKKYEDTLFSEIDKHFNDLPPDLLKMLDYLPEEFLDEEEEKYINANVLAIETSFHNGLYQFAYVQYHMLFMTAVYYALLKVYWFHEEELKNALYYLLKDRYSEFWKTTNTKSGKLYFGSFAAISESDVFMLLSVVGLDNNLLGELQKLVKERNRYAHANGQLQLTSYELFIDAIKRYNEMISKVIILLKQDMINFYLQTISDPDFYDPDIRAYIDNDDQIVQEFIRMYSLSRVELNWLRKIKVSRFDDFQGKKEIQDLHIALMHYYDMLYEDDYTPIEDPYLMFKYKGNAAGFVEKELGFNTDGCDKNVLYDCPDCGSVDQLVYDAENGKFHCFACEKNYATEELAFCEQCGSLMHRNGDSSICQNCVDIIMDE